MLIRLLLIAFLLIPAASVAAPVIMVLGDSLSASYGIDQKTGWVHLMEQRLKTEGFSYKVVNASISGETTHGAQSRLDNLLKKHSPEIVIIELGGNDGLRGLSLESMYTNLAGIIEQSLSHEADVLLTGMRIPPNYGQQYTEKFADIYTQLALTYQITLAPLLLTGLENNQAMFQADGLHPVAEAQPIILDNIWPYLARLLSGRK